MRKKLFLLAAALMSVVAAFAQPRQISGKVADANGEPLIGVGIVVKGTTTGIMTDVDGTFVLSVPENAVLEISSIGYVSQEIPVGNQTQFDIVLAEDNELLEATVVIGYGTVKRTNFTGSVTNVNVGESAVSNMPKTNALDMLRGLAPGLTMSQSGIAGAAPNLQVRGQKSISASADPSVSQPLIVLDGVIFKGSINDIDPTTIESMSVLKDATSLASYGSQAANGVIMITSKKGMAGKPMINFRGSVTLVGQNYTPQLRNGQQYVELINARQGLAADNTSWMSELEKTNYAAGKETDWIKYVSQTGVQQDYALNVSGGTEDRKLNYLFGASHSDNKGFIKGNEFIRTTITARINANINKYISAGLNFNWANMKDDGVRPSYTRFFSPYGEPEMPDGSRRKYIIGANQETAINPLWNVFEGIDAQFRGNAATIGGNVEVKIPWIEGLSYKITGNYTARNFDTKRFTHERNLILPTDTEFTTATYDKYLTQASGYITNAKQVSWVLDNILTYTREFGDHYVNATLVYTRDYSRNETVRSDGLDFSGVGNTTLGFWGLNNANTQNITTLDYALHTDVGYLARVNYSFKNKYHINASFRRDGSSVFGTEHKWGNFPAVGAAYTISDEPWFKVKAIDYLKLKLSWGKNGNQSLQPYGTLSRMAMGKSGGFIAYFDGQPVFAEAMTTLGNPYLGWETTTSWNGGWEVDFLDRLLHWETDIYVSRTTDQIFNRTILGMGSGFTTQSATMGQVNNWGIESSLRANIIRKRDFSWDATLNFSLNRNKLVKLYGGENEEDDITNGLFIGKSLGAIYGYEYVGVVQETDVEFMQKNGRTPGDIMEKDQDGDGKITPDDRVILGYTPESFRMNLNTNIRWKNWNLYMMFSGVFSDKQYGKALNNNAILSYTEGMMYLNTVNHPFWTAENKDPMYPKAWNAAGNLNYVQSYGFIRLQDVNLSYSVSEKFAKKIGLSGAQIYVSGSNLFFFAPFWKYSDPEVRNFQSAQLRRTFTVGLNVRF